jgi:hypothetical protein
MIMQVGHSRQQLPEQTLRLTLWGTGEQQQQQHNQQQQQQQEEVMTILVL